MFIKNYTSRKRRTATIHCETLLGLAQAKIHAIANVLHGLSKKTIVFQLIIVLFEIIGCRLSFRAVAINVGLKERCLFENYPTVNFGNAQTELDIKLQHTDMHDILFFRKVCQHQLLCAAVCIV